MASVLKLLQFLTLLLESTFDELIVLLFLDVKKRDSKEIGMPSEMTPESMEAILDYFYSGELALSQSNIESVFRATDYMRLDPLLDICIKYLKETLNLSNSVQHFELAETVLYSSSHLDELKKASSTLIVNGIEEISGTEDFLNLSKEHISKILKCNNQPTMAESLCSLIFKWVSHDEETRKQFLYDLLQTLPVEGISDNFFASKIRNQELLRRDSRSVLWLMDAMSRFTTKTNSPILSQPSSFFFADSFLARKCFFVKKMDNPRPQAIHDRPEFRNFSAVCHKNRIYLLCDSETEKSYQLNEPHESWIECNLDLQFGRHSAGCIVLGDDLFVVGGRKWKTYFTLKSCMKFNFCSGQKQNLPAMEEARWCPGVAVYANSLYAACGYDVSSSIERFDPREGRWCTAGQYKSSFDLCSATTVADYLYCCSLQSGNVERFDFRINRSQEICSLPSDFQKSNWISSVENELLGAHGEQIFVYDAVTDKWNDFCCATNVNDPLIVPWV